MRQAIVLFLVVAVAGCSAPSLEDDLLRAERVQGRFDSYPNATPDDDADEFIYWDTSEGAVKNATKSTLTSVFGGLTTSAGNVTLTDSGGYFTGTDVEAALAEVGPTMTDARTPTAHAATHGAGQSDAVTITEAQISDLSHTPAATAVSVDTSAFGLNLSAAENTVQKALDVLDDLVSGGTPGGSSGQLQYNNGGSFAGSLLWQGTNLIEQYSGANAQTFRLYNTRTDASNYERLFARFAANVAEIGTESSGTGTARDFRLITNADLYLGSSGDSDLLGKITFNASTGVVQLGRDASATNSGTAVGRATIASGSQSAAYGSLASATGNFSLSAGYYANVTALKGTGLGHETDVTASIGVALGSYGLANREGQTGLVRGDYLTSNYGTLSAVVQTTDGSATSFIDRIGGNYPFNIPTDHTLAFSGLVVAQKTDQTENAAWTVRGLIKNDSGTTTLIAYTIIAHGSDNSGAWSLSLAADDTNDCLQMQLTAEATVNATASLSFVEQAAANF